MKRKYFYKEVEAFGEAIRILRNRRELTQRNVAMLAGINEKYLREVEQGKHSVGLVLILMICEAMQVNVFELLILALEKEYHEFQKVVLANGARKFSRAVANENNCERARRASHDERQLSRTQMACGGGQRCYNEKGIICLNTIYII